MHASMRAGPWPLAQVRPGPPWGCNWRSSSSGSSVQSLTAASSLWHCQSPSSDSDRVPRVTDPEGRGRRSPWPLRALAASGALRLPFSFKLCSWRVARADWPGRLPSGKARHKQRPQARASVRCH